MKGPPCRPHGNPGCLCDDNYPEADAAEMAAAGVFLIGVGCVLEAAWKWAIILMVCGAAYLAWAWRTGRSVTEDVSEARDLVEDALDRYRPRPPRPLAPPEPPRAVSPPEPPPRRLPPDPETCGYTPSRDTLRQWARGNYD